MSLSNLPAWQLALRGSLPVASCIPSEKPNSLVLKEHASCLVQHKGRGRRGKGKKQWWCLLFPFGIEMRRRNPSLTFAGNRNHLPLFPGNLTPFEDHLGKDKNCWYGKLEIQSVAFSCYQISLLYIQEVVIVQRVHVLEYSYVLYQRKSWNPRH